MKHYVKVAINLETNEIEHAATSDKAFNINPFDGFGENYRTDDYEFDNEESELFVKAREFLNNVDKKTIKTKTQTSKISNLKKVT